jgi:hypothetical protein
MSDSSDQANPSLEEDIEDAIAPESELAAEDEADAEIELKKSAALRSRISTADRKFVAYTVKLPAEQLAALQSIWLELKRLYGAHSPDKSGMIQQAIEDWLKRWDGPEKNALLENLLEIREDTRRRQYKK